MAAAGSLWRTGAIRALDDRPDARVAARVVHQDVDHLGQLGRGRLDLSRIGGVNADSADVPAKGGRCRRERARPASGNAT